MSTQNTSIAKSRLGEPRFAHNPEDIAPGPVKTYYLSPEEIERRYGPVNKSPQKKKSFSLTREFLEKELIENKRSIAWVASKVGKPVEIVRATAEKLGIDICLAEEQKAKEQGVTEKREDSKVGNILERLREEFPKDKFIEMLTDEQGKQRTIKQMAEIMDCPQWAVSHLKKEYGLTGPRGKKETVAAVEPVEKKQETPSQLIMRIAALEAENKNLRQRVNELEEKLKNYVEDEIDALKRELVPQKDDRIEYLARQLEELAREFAYHRHQSVFGMYTGKPE